MRLNLKNKKIFYLFMIAIILFIIFLLLDTVLFNKKIKKEQIDKSFHVTYTIVDYDKTSKNINYDNYNVEDKRTLDTVQSWINVKKHGNYYVAKLDDGINDIVFTNISDSVFALNNVYAEMIHDLKFVKKERKVYIPKKYFESKKYKIYNGIPVKMGIMTRIKKDDFKNLSIKTKTKKFFSRNRKIYLNSSNDITRISIFKYQKNNHISKNNIKVYLNNSKYPLSNKLFDWNPSAGTIDINAQPIQINKIEIKVKKISIIKNFIFNIFNINNATAASSSTKFSGTYTYDDGGTGWSVTDFLGQIGNYSDQFPYYYGKSIMNKGKSGALICGTLCGKNPKDENKAKYYSNVSSAGSDIQTKIIKAYKSAAFTDPEVGVSALKYPDFLIDMSLLNGKVLSKSTNGKTAKLTINLEKNFMRFYCGDPKGEEVEANNPAKLAVTLKFSNSGDVITVSAEKQGEETIGTAGGQMATGSFKLTKDKTKTGSLKVQKKVYNFGNSKGTGNPHNINSDEQGYNDTMFYLYQNAVEENGNLNCTGLIDMASTENGVATFDGLDPDETYCVKEMYQEYDDNSDASSRVYVKTNTLSKVVRATPSVGGTGGTDPVEFGKAITCDASANGNTCDYYNTIVKYCYIINKSDRSKSGRTFDSGYINICETGTANCATNAGSKVPLAGYQFRSSLSVSEQSAYDSTGSVYFPTLLDSSGNVLSSVTKSQPMELVKDTDTEYHWECPINGTYTESEQAAKYQCTKVKKVDDDTGEVLDGASFKIDCQTVNGIETYSDVSDALGVATLYAGIENVNGKTCTISEVTPPKGHGLSGQTFTLDQSKLTTIDEGVSRTYTESTAAQTNVKNWCTASSEQYVYRNPSLKINWYKTTENDTASPGASFTVTGPEGEVHYDGTTDIMIDTNGDGIKETKKTCYNYSTDPSKPKTFESDANGEVCVRGVTDGKYTITETSPSQYHTFSSDYVREVDAKTDIQLKSSSNTFINLPTYFEFSKSVNDGDNTDIKIVVNGVEKSLHDLTTEELSRIDFNVYFGNTLLSFVETTENGKMIYSFGGNTIDLPAGNVVTDLHLDSERLIRISHLPKGTYTIKEKNNKVCDNNSNNNDCIGYYYPDYKQSSDYTFTITACSNDAANASACSSAGLSKGKATQKLTNKRTEIMFTKKDFYKYYDQKDIVDFENDKERSDFDRIKFKIKDASGRYLTVKKVKDVGTQTGDNSYSEYRYVSKDDNSDDGGTVMYARGGNIKITNLCRGNTYTIEEIEVPEDSVFVKENTSSTPTSVSYNIPCNELATGTDTKGSTTNIIEDKPTRIRLEKRDSKYNYLIPDETTTFKLYRCKKGEECHPGDYSSDEEREKAGMKLIKFYDRARISNDEEDPTDAEGLAGVEVYKMMSDSDIASGTKTVVDLHPYKGILVLRYLQANYNYVLLETVAPKNYQLPVGRNAETTFKPVNDTVDVDSVDVPNKPTSLLIKKYDSKGNLLPGAEFKIYDAGTSCDPNISAADQKKTELKLKTIRDGIYENRENKDTDTVKTCRDREDEKCSDINPNAITKLTYETNLGNWSDFADESTKTEDGKKIEIQEGTALIQYLEYGHCYVIEETKAPDGHSLPTKDKDRFTMVTIKENDEYAHSTYYKFINKPTPFQFYKYDEFNKLLDGAEFKLQKLDDNKKYHDVTVSLDDDLKNLETIDEKDAEKLNKKITELKTQAESGVPFYKVDTTTDNTTITTKNGTAVVYYLSPGQYRILETKAAPGKELSKNPNIATFFVDSNGNVFGNSIIVNKSKTEKIQVKNSASAELVVNVQTGQTVIKYGLIISVIAALITGLMILRKRMK